MGETANLAVFSDNLPPNRRGKSRSPFHGRVERAAVGQLPVPPFLQLQRSGSESSNADGRRPFPRQRALGQDKSAPPGGKFSAPPNLARRLLNLWPGNRLAGCSPPRPDD
jgi:hypothetical protein